MRYVTTVFHRRKVILLSGASLAKKTDVTIDIEAPDELLDVARRNPDAVAFGYIMGRWVAAA
jgi:hypothetical protein